MKKAKSIKNMSMIAGTAIAATAVGTSTIAHADSQPTTSTETTQSTPQQQLANTKNANDQQLQTLASENSKAESAKQQEIDQNIQAVQSQTEQVIAKNDQQISSNEQKLHEQDQQALSRETESVNASAQKQVSAENTSYNQSVSTQTTANQASEDALAKQNDQALQEASKHVVTPAQKDALTKSATDQFNAGKQAAEQQFTDATNKANDDHQTKLNELNTAKQNDVNNAQAKHEQAIATQQQANDQAIANAQHAYDNTVANAPKISDATKPAQPATSVNDLTDPQWADPEGLNDETKPYYPIVHVARWNNIENSWFKNPQAMKVSNKDQLPMDFKPGIILYDATNDHSAKIASTGLTEDQKRELNTLSNHWLNQVRHYFWDVLQIQKTNPNAKINGYYNGTRELTVKDFAPQAPIHDLFTPNEYWQQVGQVISRGREKYGTNYEHTTAQASNKFTLKDHNQTGWNDGSGDYSGVISLWGQWNSAHNDTALEGSLYDPETNGSKIESLETGENLYRINGSTMLEMEVSLYNKLQEMAYGEYQGQISNTDKTPLIGGHLANVLNPKFQFVTMAFQNATTDPTFKALPNTGSNYYVMWDFAGIQDESVSENALKKGTAEGGKWVDISKTDTSIDKIDTVDSSETGYDLIDPNGEINTGIVDQIHAAQTDSNAKPNLNDPSVISAKQNLDHVKSDAETKLSNVKNANPLDQINADYAAKINAENDHYNDQIKQIKDQRDQNLAKLNKAYSDKIAQIKALPKSTDQLKAQLDQKMTDLKNANAKKLTDLKKEHEDKLKSIETSRQSTIDDYKQRMQDTFNTRLAGMNQNLTEDNQRLKNELKHAIELNNQSLTNLKRNNQAKYNALAEKLNNEYTALQNKLFPKQTTEEINHHEVVSQTNDHVELGSHTVVLPTTSTALTTSTAKITEPTVVSSKTPTSNETTTENAVTENEINESTVVSPKTASKNISKNTSSDSTMTHLPQTGSEESMLTVILGIMLSVLSLGLITPKKDN